MQVFALNPHMNLVLRVYLPLLPVPKVLTYRYYYITEKGPLKLS